MKEIENLNPDAADIWSVLFFLWLATKFLQPSSWWTSGFHFQSLAVDGWLSEEWFELSSSCFCAHCFLLCGTGECHLTCLWHTVAFILSVKHTSWGNSRICVAELQLPWVINTQPSGYVVGLIGCWACSRQAEQFGAEPCMKPLYCLELPVLPERRGQLLFTRSHTYTVYVLVCSIVSSSLCVCGFHTFLPNGSKKTRESFSSFCITLLYKDECLWARLIYSKCQNSLSRHELGCTCLHHLTQNVSAIYHSRKVMHDHPLTPGNGRLYLWAREHLLSCQGQPPGISIVQYTTVWVR